METKIQRDQKIDLKNKPKRDRKGNGKNHAEIEIRREKVKTNRNKRVRKDQIMHFTWRQKYKENIFKNKPKRDRKGKGKNDAQTER